MPSTMTLSPFCRPLVTTVSAPSVAPDLDAPLLDLARLVDHEHVGPDLIDQHRRLRDDEAGRCLRGLNDDAYEHTVDEQALRILERRADGHRVGRLVHLDVDEVDLADLGIHRPIGQLELDIEALAVGLARLLLLLHIEELPRAHREGDVDRILANQRGERAACGLDQIADAVVRAADPATDRGGDLGIAEVELGLLEGSLLVHQVCPGLGELIVHLVEALLRHRLALHQVGIALLLDLGEVEGRLRLGDAGLHLVDLGLVGRLLDHEEQLALLDLAAFLEIPLLEEAFHAGTEVDRVDRLDASGEVEAGGDVLLRHGHDTDGRRGRLGGRLLLLALAATGQKEAREHQGRKHPGQPAGLRPGAGRGGNHARLLAGLSGPEAGRLTVAPARR